MLYELLPNLAIFVDVLHLGFHWPFAVFFALFTPLLQEKLKGRNTSEVVAKMTPLIKKYVSLTGSSAICWMISVGMGLSVDLPGRTEGVALVRFQGSRALRSSAADMSGGTRPSAAGSF